MKKKLFPVRTCALIALVGATVSGCPVYDDDAGGCYDDYDCSVGYYCDYPSGACLREGSSGSCEQPSDCAANETCSKSGICAEGDCHFASVGCVQGFECSGESGRWECVREGSGPVGGGGDGSGASGGVPATSGGAPTSNAGAPIVDGGEPSSGGMPTGGAPSEPAPSAGAGGN
jgi:hypothetical protein